MDLPGSRAEAQPAAAPSTAAAQPQPQGAEAVQPEPSQTSTTGAGWQHSYAADPANSPRATWAGTANAEGVKEAERAAADGPDSRPDGFPVMQALLCEERLDFQHVFEDSAPGMPWARVSFQVCKNPPSACFQVEAKNQQYLFRVLMHDVSPLLLLSGVTQHAKRLYSMQPPVQPDLNCPSRNPMLVMCTLVNMA